MLVRLLSASLFLGAMILGWSGANAASVSDEAREAYFRNDFARAHDLCIQTDYQNSDAQCANLLGLIAEKGFAKERTPLEFFLISERLGNYKGAYNAAQRLFASDPQRALGLFAKAFPDAVADNNGLLAAQSLTMIAWSELTTDSGQNCQSAIGDERSRYLVKLCSRISPATHPPCNASNSCKLISDEIIRGCELDKKLGGDTDYCAPFLSTAKVMAEAVPQAPPSVQGSSTSSANPSTTPRQPAEPQAPPPAQASGNDLGVTDMLVAFVIIALGVMLLIFLFRRLGVRGSIGLIINVIALGIAFAIHPGLGVALLLFDIAWLIWHGLKRLLATKCSKCGTRMKAAGEKVLDREEKHVRKGFGRDARVCLVEELTVREWEDCPKCGHQIYRDVTRTNELGERIDLIAK